MGNLITFPNSYIFVAGYDVYRRFIGKYASSLPVNGNNIAYLKAPEKLMNCDYLNDVIDYYKKNLNKYTQETAKVTLLESPLLNALVNLTHRYQKHHHISQEQFESLYNKSMKYIQEYIDMSSVFYIYLRYYALNPRDPGRVKDSFTADILSTNDIFKYMSIYSKEEDRIIARFDRLISYRLDNVSRSCKFKEIINKKD